MRRWVTISCAAILAASAVSLRPAAAQSDLQNLLDRVDRLERDIGTVQRQVYRGGSPANTVVTSPMARDGGEAPSAPPSSLPSDLATRIEVRLSQLEGELRRLTGQVEQANYSAGQVGSRLDRAVADIEFRLKELEQRNASPVAPTQGTPTPPPAAPPQGAAGPTSLGTIPLADLKAVPPTPPAARPAPEKPAAQFKTSKEQYEHAFKLLHSDYAAAEQAFRAFLETWPDDPLAGNAQYWLGESHYVRNEFDKAAVVFLKGYQKYGKSPKAPDSLLKLGLSLAALGQQKEACAAFGRLSSEYPDAADQVKRKLEAERQKLHCR